MLHLVCSTSPPPLINAYASISTNLKHYIFLRVHCNYPSRIVLRRRSIIRNGGAEKDSEFEVDPDKAREALRQLDQQLNSLSQKKITPPKIRATAADIDQQDYPWSNEEPADVSGSFLTVLASALLVFTIVYNVIFATVIKPSIDGDDREVPALALNVTTDVQEEPSIDQTSVTTPRIPVGL